MAVETKKFEKQNLLKIKPPEKVDGKSGGIYDTYKDSKEDGLQLIVSSGGAKTFYLRKRVNNRHERIKIGTFPDISIENARKKAQELKGEIAKGLNPNQERRKIRNEHTFKELIDKYIDEHAKLHNKGWQDELDRFDLHLKHLYKKKISQISKDELQKLHRDIGTKSGVHIANRLLSRIKTLFNMAIDNWQWEGRNPANGIKNYKTQSRERFLQPDELPRFLEAIAAEEDDAYRDYFTLSLLTGARKGNLLSMHFADIDFSNKFWRIPDSKNGEPINVPLLDQAIELLHQRQKQLKSGFVFPSNLSKAGHIQDPKKAWKRLLEKAELSNLRIHDIRRTLGSYQAITGASLPIIGKSLGHKSSKATEIYSRLLLDPVRFSMDKAADMIFARNITKKEG